jgi:glucans biosynthesis protein
MRPLPALLLASALLAGAAPAFAADPAQKPKPAKPAKPAAPAPAPVADTGEPFTFEKVVRIARDRASRPFEAPAADLPPAVASASYDDHRKLRFRRERALWHGKARFEAQFFHMGFLFKTPVKVNVVERGQASRVVFDKAMFDYGDTGLAKAITKPLDFAGFRVHYDLNDPGYKDELIVFLGASYFRFLGRQQRYGLSARALAVDTAEPRGEEFPFFREFWLATPDPQAVSLTVYALLDSHRVAGAYEFVIHPATETWIDVRARLFFRAEIGKLGIAPLTSMHLFGENRARAFDDHRPEVHDSDGVSIHSGSGQWLWRPLVNGRDLRVSAFVERDPKGFGLMQRDRNFSHYQDLESEYHHRPSYWVEPVGAWGEGTVELIEIPSNEEIHDNIVVFWVPRDRPAAGEERSLDYRLRSLSDGLPMHELGRVAETRLGSPVVPGTGGRPTPTKRLFVIDFEGGELPFLGPDLEIQPEIVTSKGEITDPHVVRLPDGGRWRITFRLDTGGESPVELMAKLVLDGRPITETWLYRYTP